MLASHWQDVICFFCYVCCYSTSFVLFLLSVELTGCYKDAVFDQRDVEFTLGEGENHGIVEGLEIALIKFKKGEKSRLKIQSKYGYGSAGCPEKNIPADAELTYEVTLKEFEKVRTFSRAA